MKIEATLEELNLLQEALEALVEVKMAAQASTKNNANLYPVPTSIRTKADAELHTAWELLGTVIDHQMAYRAPIEVLKKA